MKGRGPVPVENTNKDQWAIEDWCVMGQKEKVASVLNMVGGRAENVEKIVDEIDRFFNTINAELEDWKVSMEEYKEGTRIYARFQVLMKK